MRCDGKKLGEKRKYYNIANQTGKVGIESQKAQSCRIFVTIVHSFEYFERLHSVYLNIGEIIQY